MGARPNSQSVPPTQVRDPLGPRNREPGGGAMPALKYLPPSFRAIPRCAGLFYLHVVFLVAFLGLPWAWPQPPLSHSGHGL